MMGWQKFTSITNYQYMMSIHNASSNVVCGLSIHKSGSNEGCPYFYNNGQVNASLTAVNFQINDGEWHHVCAVMHSDDKYLYVDGQLAARDANGGGYQDFSAMTSVHIGAYTANGTTMLYQHTGSLALIKISRDYVSAAQVKKIYEDEKKLFAPNAKCTLYGTSDAVKSIALDKVTEIMHVGTPSGRSDFQGLRRINNTTTAVTSTISASGGLIAEQ